jgi:hypothetical protein
VIPTTIEEYEDLAGMSKEQLANIGCRMWDSTDNYTHWLFPKEWFDHIPDGLEIMSISGNREVFQRGVTDGDTRFGMLAFGFFQGSSLKVWDIAEVSE